MKNNLLVKVILYPHPSQNWVNTKSNNNNYYWGMTSLAGGGNRPKCTVWQAPFVLISSRNWYETLHWTVLDIIVVTWVKQVSERPKNCPAQPLSSVSIIFEAPHSITSKFPDYTWKTLRYHHAKCHADQLLLWRKILKHTNNTRRNSKPCTLLYYHRAVKRSTKPSATG